MSEDRALTIRQPYASLIVAGIKDVENRSWPVPSTLPQWQKCSCGHRLPKWVDNGGTCNWRNVGPFPFCLWIHAGKRFDRAGNKAVMNWAMAVSDETRRRGSGPLLSPVKEMMRLQDPAHLGVLLGSVLVTGCHWSDECRTAEPWVHSEGVIIGHCSPWADEDAYHWTLADPQPLPEPIPMKGRQGLWRLPDDVAVPA